MNINETEIISLAPNASANSNGHALYTKKKFSNARISPDKDLIWAECAGSGKNPYYCSADYVDENNPVFRCSCPSRQFPCKHALGLLYFYSNDEKSFTEVEVPDDIAEKRGKIEKRVQKKKEETTIAKTAAKPKKVNATTVIKRIDKQLEGLTIADTLLNTIVHSGLSSMDGKLISAYKTQIKELGNYNINGIQTAFNHLILEVQDVKNDDYTKAIDHVNVIASLLKKSRAYLNECKDEPTKVPEITSAIEEQIGRAWKLNELAELQQYEENSEILQLSFNCFDHSARKEFVDEGIWFNLASGKLFTTLNYRPYRAAKYIQQDNSDNRVHQLGTLYIYPGDLNPRIRWENAESKTRNVTEQDFKQILQHAHKDYDALIKQIKNSIKNPLADKNPVALIQMGNLALHNNVPVITDQQGATLVIQDIPEHAPSTTIFKNIMPATEPESALLVKFHNDLSKGLFAAQVLAIVRSNGIIRLIY